MFNKITMFFLIGLFFLSTPVAASVAENGAVDMTVIAEPDKGDFEGDVSDAAADMLESLSEMRRHKFFSGLNRLIEKGDIKKAEKLLKKRDKEVPGQKSDEAYAIAKSKIAYAKGDYKSAYAEADGLITEVEKVFAPQKPYEVAFKNKNERDTVFDVYILRFQALYRMQRHEEALADLNRAQQLVESSELFISKASILLWLGRYAEAAEAADKSYSLNKDTFAASPYRTSFCDNFRSQGYHTKACAGPASAARYPTGEKTPVR